MNVGYSLPEFESYTRLCSAFAHISNSTRLPFNPRQITHKRL